MTADQATLPPLDEVVHDLMGSSLLDGCDVRLIEVDEPPPIDPAAACRAALQAPRGTPPLRDLRRRIVTPPRSSPATRPAPCPAPPCCRRCSTNLPRPASPPERVTVVIGTGAHRPATDDELRTILGDLFGRVARAQSRCASGRPRRGRPLAPRHARADQSHRRRRPTCASPWERSNRTSSPASPAAARPSCRPWPASTRSSPTTLSTCWPSRRRPRRTGGNPIHEEMLEAARLAASTSSSTCRRSRAACRHSRRRRRRRSARRTRRRVRRRGRHLRSRDAPTSSSPGPTGRSTSTSTRRPSRSLVLAPLVGQRSAVLLAQRLPRRSRRPRDARPVRRRPGADEVLSAALRRPLRGRAQRRLHAGRLPAPLPLRRRLPVRASPTTALRTLLLQPVADPHAGLERDPRRRRRPTARRADGAARRLHPPVAAPGAVARRRLSCANARRAAISSRVSGWATRYRSPSQPAPAVRSRPSWRSSCSRNSSCRPQEAYKAAPPRTPAPGAFPTGTSAPSFAPLASSTATPVTPAVDRLLSQGRVISTTSEGSGHEDRSALPPAMAPAIALERSQAWPPLAGGSIPVELNPNQWSRV